MKAAYRRVLIKVSGEAFCSAVADGGTNGRSCIQPAALEALTDQLLQAHGMGVQIGLVVGGGNFFRGRSLAQADCIGRPTADAMGMLATVINALALRDSLEHRGVDARVLSAIPAGGICEPFAQRRAMEHLDKSRIVIFAGGTGNPFFTTDTCAALRACQVQADVLLKATKVDGVFEADPVTNPHAKRFDRLTYAQVLSRQLGVMDLAAISLCMESRIPVVVFRLDKPGNLAAAVAGQAVGTVVSAD